MITRQNRIQRHKRIRTKISGTKSRPRLSVFRSNKHLHLQLIDDVSGKTLVSASTKEVKDVKTKEAQARSAGKLVAEKALQSGIKEAVFDRGGNKFHGRVAKVAEGAREAGLKF